MDRSELAPLLGRLYDTSREQLDLTLELICSLTAAIQALDQIQPGFGVVYQERLEILKCGDLKKKQVGRLAAFGSVLDRLKKLYKA